MVLFRKWYMIPNVSVFCSYRKYFWWVQKDCFVLLTEWNIRLSLSITQVPCSKWRFSEELKGLAAPLCDSLTPLPHFFRPFGKTWQVVPPRTPLRVRTSRCLSCPSPWEPRSALAPEPPPLTPAPLLSVWSTGRWAFGVLAAPSFSRCQALRRKLPAQGSGCRAQSEFVLLYTLGVGLSNNVQSFSWNFPGRASPRHGPRRPGSVTEELHYIPQPGAGTRAHAASTSSCLGPPTRLRPWDASALTLPFCWSTTFSPCLEKDRVCPAPPPNVARSWVLVIKSWAHSALCEFCFDIRKFPGPRAACAEGGLACPPWSRVSWGRASGLWSPHTGPSPQMFSGADLLPRLQRNTGPLGLRDRNPGDPGPSARCSCVCWLEFTQ